VLDTIYQRDWRPKRLGYVELEKASTGSGCATVGHGLGTVSTLSTPSAWGIGVTFTHLALSLVLELFLFLFLFCQLFLTLFVTVVGCCQVVLSSSYEDFNILQMRSATACQLLSLIWRD